jgi:hypothetical protein
MQNEELRMKKQGGSVRGFFILNSPFSRSVPLWNRGVSFSEKNPCGGKADANFARKTCFSIEKLGLAVALRAAMSSCDSIHKKTATTPEQNGAEHFQEPAQNKFDPSRHIAPLVAHELNNILTIVQGYADRLLMKHGGEPALQPHLKLISEASKRAATIIREATPPNASQHLRRHAASQTPVV